LSSKKNSKLSPQARPHCRRREPYPHFTYDQNQAVLKDKSSPSQRPVARVADILSERSNRHSRCDGSADITRRSDGVDKRGKPCSRSWMFAGITMDQSISTFIAAEPFVGAMSQGD
jgi:hypothetical protein